MLHLLLLRMFPEVWHVQFASRFTPFEGMWANLFIIQNAAGDFMQFRGKVEWHLPMLTGLSANSL